MALVGDTKSIPFEVALIQSEVANFCRTARDLNLCNPKTGLDFDNYQLVVFHYELVTDTTGSVSQTITRPCTVFGAMPIKRYSELYLNEAGKHKEGFKNVVPELTDLAQYVCLFDFNFDQKDPASFLDAKQLSRQRTFQYCRKTIGVEMLQFLSFSRRLINDFAPKIVSIIFRLDWPTDESTESAAQEVLGLFIKKP